MNYKYSLLIVIAVLCSTIAGYAQYENVWVFGGNAGMDFNSGSPVGIYTSINSKEASASVCNRQGQLLFYTDGDNIWNRNHKKMPRGSDIVPSPYITWSTAQGALIVPAPGPPNKYYVFSLTELGERLYYSVVNMDMDTGRGDIIPGKKGVLLSVDNSESMTAVVGDRCNVWILTRSRYEGFRAFELTVNGLDTTPVVSNIGSWGNTWGAFGMLEASSDGRKLVQTVQGRLEWWRTEQGLPVFDFDPSTGRVSNMKLLDTMDAYRGVSFSPDNTKLYVEQVFERTDFVKGIYQYDLSSTDPATTKTMIWHNENLSSNTDLKSGPGGKIYFNHFKKPGEYFLNTIDSPNRTGMDCHITENVVALFRDGWLVSSVDYNLPHDVPVLPVDTIVTHTNISGGCITSPLLLKALDSTGWKYQWTGGVQTPELIINRKGRYAVSYSTPCQYHIDSFNVIAVPEVPITGIMKSCKYEANGAIWVHPVSGDTNIYTYSWHDAWGKVLRTQNSITGDTIFNLAQGDYRLYINQGGYDCDTFVDILLTALEYDASFTVDSALCLHDSISFTSTSEGISSWYWYFGDGDTAAGSIATHTFREPGVYTSMLIGLTDQPYCKDTFYTNIKVDSIPYVYFATDGNSTCVGNTINFRPSYRQGATRLAWDFDGSGNQKYDLSPSHSYDQAGVYNVMLTASYPNCHDTSFIDTVSVFPFPVVDLGGDTSLCTGNMPIILKNSKESSLSSYKEWNTGDTSVTIKVTHPGIYSLTLTSEYGCTTSDSIIISKFCYLDIPNSFTPNGDGLNDYFFPRGLLSKGITSCKMDIYSRWGQVVFTTDRIDGRGWDGRFNDVTLPAGVYVYSITVKLEAGDILKEERYHGNVTLIR